MIDLNDMTPAQRMKERDNALWMALDGQAKSEEAQALVRSIMGTFAIEWMPADMQRRRQRMGAIHTALEALLCDLIGAANAGRWSKRSMRRGDFTGQRVAYRTFILVCDTLENAGLIDRLKGFSDRSGFGATGSATCLRLTDQGLTLVRQHGVDPGFHGEHFATGSDQKALIAAAVGL